MTRKNYVKIATVFYLARPHTPEKSFTGPTVELWSQIVENMADTLAVDNPRFDKERFINYCVTGK